MSCVFRILLLATLNLVSRFDCIRSFLFNLVVLGFFFFFSSRRRHTRFDCDWSSDVCSSDLALDVPERTTSLMPSSRATSQSTSTGAPPIPPPLNGSGARRVHRTTPSARGSQIGRASCRERV